MNDKIIGSFFHAEKSIVAQIYLQVLQDYVAPQLEVYHLSVIFKQDDAPPHWGLEVRKFLNEIFPD